MQRRILKKIGKLAGEPRPPGSKQLEGGGGEMRLRIGDYRVIYAVADEVLRVLVLKIGPRKDIYRRR